MNDGTSFYQGDLILHHILFILLLCLSLVISILIPEVTLKDAKNAFSMFLNILLPSLFPFMLFMDLLLKTKTIHLFSPLFSHILKPLFKIPGEGFFALFTGFLSGYPGGAITVTKMRQENILSRSESERLIAFCNNASPVFITGAVGASLLQNSALGILLLKNHLMSAIVVGLVFRFLIQDSSTSKRPLPCKPSFALASQPISIHTVTNSILNTFKTLAIICGYVVLFGVFVGVLKHYEIVTTTLRTLLPHTFSSVFASFIYGFFEITEGLRTLSTQKSPISFSLPLMSFMLGWGSLSIHLQTISILHKTDIRWTVYIAGKFLHGVLSALFTWSTL